MVRIAIVEDESVFAERLQKDVLRWYAQAGEVCRIDVYADGYDLAECYKTEYDLLLMDVEMKLMDGMEAARIVREHDASAVIIFITNNPQYAIMGYQVQAMDYLLKPVTYERLASALQRAQREIEKRAAQPFLSLTSREGTVKLPIKDILSVESSGFIVPIFTLQFHSKSFTISIQNRNNGGKRLCIGSRW